MNNTGSGTPLLDTFPDLETFCSAHQHGKSQVIWTKLIADLETPVSAYLKVASDKRHCFLLESVEGGSQRGRYSIIGLEPDLIWRANGNNAELNASPLSDGSTFETCDKPMLDSLRDLLAASRIDLPESLPPMAAGVFGYMGYDTVRLVERLPDIPPDDLGVPDAILMRPTVMIIFDDVKDEMTLVTPARVKTDGETSTTETTAEAAKQAYRDGVARLQAVVQKLAGSQPQGPQRADGEIAAPTPTSNTPEHRYLDMVRKAKDYIVAGDIFQVVLSQRFSTPFSLSSFALYRALRRLNPSPFLFHLDFADFALVGSSPEILVRVRDGQVTIRPIAGTAPRGRNEADDQALADALLADPKERAEHLMLLDLGRNDVGRVAEIGTVDVTHQFIVERYSHVMHIVSNVVGNLDQTHDPVDALMAGFPAGTVSGAPKVRAMEIIDELEASKRGPYAGCVGYFSADGQMDTCIVLRTALIKDGMLHVQAGAGLVHDSVPEKEQQECINKAKAIVRAAEEAVRFATGGKAGGGSGEKSNNGNMFK